MNKNLLILVFALSGMAALIYEIIWIRPLTLVFGSSVYAVSTIISSFILGLAIGSWLAGKYSDRISNPLKYFSMFQIGIGIYGVLLLPVFSFLPGIYIEFYNLTFPNLYIFQFIQIVMSMALITIPAAMMGTTLPLMIKTYSNNFSTIGADVGRLDAANSMGAVFGTLAAGFLMLPLLGVQDSIVITALINFAIGISILAKKRYVKYQYLIGIVIVILAIFWFVPGYDVKSLNHGIYTSISPGYTNEERTKFLEKDVILFYKESLYSPVIVTSFEGHETLTINGKAQCGSTPGSIKGVNRLASIPYEMFIKNYGKPQNALVVGLGCGYTSEWLSTKTNTTTIEIDNAVAESSKLFIPKIEHNLVIDDARNWLLRNEEKFDIIMGQPQDPFENNGSLFTKEYFELLNRRLTDNGVVSQWVPMFELSYNDWYIFYNTFHYVFPNVYLFRISQTGLDEIIMIGSKKPLEVDDKIYYLGSHERFNPIKTVLNTDDRNILEFSTAINLYQQYSKSYTNATIG